MLVRYNYVDICNSILWSGRNYWHLSNTDIKKRKKKLFQIKREKIAVGLLNRRCEIFLIYLGTNKVNWSRFSRVIQFPIYVVFFLYNPTVPYFGIKRFATDFFRRIHCCYRVQFTDILSVTVVCYIVSVRDVNWSDWSEIW